MNIQVVRIFKLNEGGALKAFVDLNIDDLLLIKGLRVVQGQQGLFVSMPQEQGKDHRWYETVRCMTEEIKEQLTNTVLAAYNEGEYVDENDVIIP
jgi:stage V sporulation protein G